MANLQLGDKALPFELPATDGNSYALADFGDKAATAVIFSCNHCPYVKAWEDRMVAIQADYANKGVQFVAINSNDAEKYPDDDFAAMKVRAKEKNFNFPYLFDESQSVAHAYGAQRTPEVFLFDGNGVLRYHGAIDDNYENPEGVKHPYLRQALDAVLADKAPAVPTTAPVGCSVKYRA